jgi:E3 ubiquitin-protein ligase SHPRH
VTRTKFAADKAVAESELRKKLGQLLYLNNLEKAHDHLEGGINPEPCPICQKELGDEVREIVLTHSTPNLSRRHHLHTFKK